MGYSILLVDDDHLLVEKLQASVHWEEIGISVVLTANNIRQARELLEKYPINIILCDVDMPQGSGLELMEWVRDRNLQVECIFLSGYANFAYAQKAMALSSREYLLKPISNRELESSLGRLTEEMDRKNKAEVSEWSRNVQPIWREILHGSYREDQLIEDLIENRIYPEDARFQLFSVQILDANLGDKYNSDMILLDFAITNIMEEFFASYQLEGVVHVRDRFWQCVLWLERDIPSLREEFERFRDQLKEVMSNQIFLYVPKSCNLAQIPERKEKIRQMEEGILPNHKMLYWEEDLSNTCEYDEAPWRDWIKQLQSGKSPSELETQLLDYLTRNDDAGRWTPESMKRFFRQFEQFLNSYVSFWGMQFSDLFGEEYFEKIELTAVKSIFGAMDTIHWVFEILEGNWNTGNRTDLIVDQIKNYVREHLGEDLSRAVLARQVFLSEDYVSKIFTKSAGMSISNYVSAERMKKAGEYLLTTNESVSRIALRVGFTNFSYFSKLFREYSGYTPNEYRNRR